MWMAEWLFTDFLERAVTAARRGGDDASAGFRPGTTLDAHGADHVEKRGQREHEREQHAKKKFRGDQFTDEIELQNQENRQSPTETLSENFVLPESICVLLQFQ